jgi:hypothetical protein
VLLWDIYPTSMILRALVGISTSCTCTPYSRSVPQCVYVSQYDINRTALTRLDCFELSWRTGQLPSLAVSDWKLHFGETVFNVHTAVLGDGPRRSELLHAQFARFHGVTLAASR